MAAYELVMILFKKYQVCLLVENLKELYLYAEAFWILPAVD